MIYPVDGFCRRDCDGIGTFMQNIKNKKNIILATLKRIQSRAAGRVLLLMVFISPLFGQTSGDLNNAGFRLYQAKKYPEALEFFNKAIEADGRNSMAHYNLACTLGLLRSQGQVCQHNAYRGVILDHLVRAVELDNRIATTMQKDTDLNSVHDTFRYQILTGLSVSNDVNLRLILTRVSWYGPSPGVYGPVSGLLFKSNGTGILRVLDVSEGVVRKETGFHYTIQQGRIIIRLDRAVQLGDETLDTTRGYTGQLGPDGILNIELLPGPFNDDPGDCSA